MGSPPASHVRAPSCVRDPWCQRVHPGPPTRLGAAARVPRRGPRAITAPPRAPHMRRTRLRSCGLHASGARLCDVRASAQHPRGHHTREAQTCGAPGGLDMSIGSNLRMSTFHTCRHHTREPRTGGSRTCAPSPHARGPHARKLRTHAFHCCASHAGGLHTSARQTHVRAKARPGLEPAAFSFQVQTSHRCTMPADVGPPLRQLFTRPCLRTCGAQGPHIGSRGSFAGLAVRRCGPAARLPRRASLLMHLFQGCCICVALGYMCGCRGRTCV